MLVSCLVFVPVSVLYIVKCITLISITWKTQTIPDFSLLGLLMNISHDRRNNPKQKAICINTSKIRALEKVDLKYESINTEKQSTNNVTNNLIPRLVT